MSGSPTEVVAAAFAAMASDDWQTVAELTHPRTLQGFRSREISHVLAWADFMAKDEATRGSGFGSSGETKPELLARFADQTLDWLPERPTIGNLAAMEPKDFLARWLKVAHAGRTLGPRASNARREILGEVPESDELTHVVYRGPAWLSSIHLMSLGRDGGRWLLLQNDDVLRHVHIPIPGRLEQC